MNTKLLTFIFLFAFFINTEALKCYKCINCEENKAEEEVCTNDQTVCLKFTAGNYSHKQCASKGWCELGNFQKGIRNTWNNVLNLFNQLIDKKGETEFKAALDSPGQAVNCCESELCNGAGVATSSFYLLPVSLFFAFIKMF